MFFHPATNSLRGEGVRKTSDVGHLLHQEEGQLSELQCVQEAYMHRPVPGLQHQPPITTQAGHGLHPQTQAEENQQEQGQPG